YGCPRMLEKNARFLTCTQVRIRIGWLRNLTPHWQNVPEGAERSRCDHFRLAKGTPDMAQHRSCEEVASGVSCIGAPREIESDTGPCQGEGMAGELKRWRRQDKIFMERLRRRH